MARRMSLVHVVLPKCEVHEVQLVASKLPEKKITPCDMALRRLRLRLRLRLLLRMYIVYIPQRLMTRQSSRSRSRHFGHGRTKLMEAGRKRQSGSFHGMRIRAAIVTAAVRRVPDTDGHSKTL